MDWRVPVVSDEGVRARVDETGGTSSSAQSAFEKEWLQLFEEAEVECAGSREWSRELSPLRKDLDMSRCAITTTMHVTEV